MDSGDNAKKLKIGRLEDERAQAFIKVTHYLENHEQKSIDELILQMTKYLDDTKY